MNISNLATPRSSLELSTVSAAQVPAESSLLQQNAQNQNAEHSPELLRETFDRFVGQTFYGQLLGAMRRTSQKPAYFHGGRAEEIFQGQLDQLLSEQLSQVNSERLTGPLFELFHLPQR